MNGTTEASAGAPARHFCTYFDSNYLLKGLALYRSLRRHSPGATLHVLALDDRALRTLRQLALPDLVAVPLADLEQAAPELLAAKGNRSTVEYYFTCTSPFVRWLRERTAPGEPLTYVDADLWFFASPEPLFDDPRGASVTIIGHRFAPEQKHLEIHGVYNVGWLSFADDAEARACLAWWSERCLEWCYDRIEDGRFADQKYLDDWPTRFPGVRVIANLGANVAPWNVATQPIARRGGVLVAGETPLLFFHFAAFKRLTPWLFEPSLANYGVRITPALRAEVYLPYITECRAIERWLRRTAPGFGKGWGSVRRPGWLGMAQRLLRGELLLAP